MVRWSSGPRYHRCRQRASRVIRTLAGTFVTFRGRPSKAGSIGRRLGDRILGFARARAYEPEVSEAIRRLVREARPVLLIEFHDDAEWNGRFELYNAGYELWARGQRLAIDAGLGYHCLATPLA